MPAADLTKLIEAAIRDRLVLGVTYRALDGTEMVSFIEPLAIRFNKAGHRVLWCFNRGAGHIEQLLWDGIEGASATGDVFDPRPWVEES
jgi:predicted DNA-binding transcriptional regulator YafY